jgi:hypothetical protein
MGSSPAIQCTTVSGSRLMDALFSRMFEQFQFSDGEVEVLAEMLDLVWEDAAARSGAGWCGQLRHGSSENWTRILIIYICIYI